MKRRYRQHVNPLKMTALVPREAPLALPSGPEVEVELGCGDAQFLIQRAGSEPDRHFVGLDIRDEFMAFGREEIARQGLDNIELQVSNLIVDLDRLFERGRVARFHINFPDPWFKARQKNRRWITDEAMGHLVAALQEGGEIFFQSDVWDLSLQALSVLEASAALYNAAGEWTFTRENPFAARSQREETCQEGGLPIWRLLFVRERESTAST
jgi:tRNA (guanine-N7-)-methyltransferase